MEYYRCLDCSSVFGNDELKSDLLCCPSCAGRLEGGFYQESEVVPVDVKPEATHEPKRFICPHCEESISADVILCPYCAENVNNAPSESEPTAAATATSSEAEDIINKTANKVAPPSSEIDLVKTKMRKLEALLADGIISQEEFNTKRQQIITGFLETEGNK